MRHVAQWPRALAGGSMTVLAQDSWKCEKTLKNWFILAASAPVGAIFRAGKSFEPQLELFFEQGKVSCYLSCVYHRARKMNPKFQIQKYDYMAECVATAASFEIWYELWKQIESWNLVFKITYLKSCNTFTQITYLYYKLIKGILWYSMIRQP